jgi:hypothetical protein
MIHIRRGVTRTVLITRRWAIKVPQLKGHDKGLPGVLWSLARGLLANLSEQKWSHTPGVCPVRWSIAGGLINIYPRCEPIDHEPTPEEYESTGYFGPADKSRSNVGHLNGKLVFLDYDQEWNDRPPCIHIESTSRLARSRRGVHSPQPPKDAEVL